MFLHLCFFHLDVLRSSFCVPSSNFYFLSSSSCILFIPFMLEENDSDHPNIFVILSCSLSPVIFVLEKIQCLVITCRAEEITWYKLLIYWWTFDIFTMRRKYFNDTNTSSIISNTYDKNLNLCIWINIANKVLSQMFLWHEVFQFIFEIFFPWYW